LSSLRHRRDNAAPPRPFQRTWPTPLVEGLFAAPAAQPNPPPVRSSPAWRASVSLSSVDLSQKAEERMKLKTKVKTGGTCLNHNQTVIRFPK